MGQLAQHVYTDSAAIARLTDLIGQLTGNARVAVTCKDGKRYAGIVCVRPTVQAFRDRDGVEGINGVLRLEDASAPGGERRIWLDQIDHVQRLDSISGKFAA